MAFSLNEENGEISMNGRVPAGEYSIKVNVYDAAWDLNAESTVKIVIKDIKEEAVLSSGSLRFQGNCVIEILFYLLVVEFHCFDAVGWITGGIWPVKTSASKPLEMAVNVNGWSIA